MKSKPMKVFLFSTVYPMLEQNKQTFSKRARVINIKMDIIPSLEQELNLEHHLANRNFVFRNVKIMKYSDKSTCFVFTFAK